MTKRIDKEAGLHQVDEPEWVEYLSSWNEGDTVYPRAFVHALLNDPESPLCQDRRSGEPKLTPETDCPACNAHLIIIEGNVEDEKGLYTTLRSAVKQVRDEMRNKFNYWSRQDPRDKDAVLFAATYKGVNKALTRILNKPETEADKFKRKTKPVTTRIGKD